MELDQIFLRIGLAAVVFLGATLAAEWWGRKAMWMARQAEGVSNEKYNPPSEDEMKWHIVHVRDDIASITTSQSVTHGLLAAILAVLILG